MTGDESKDRDALERVVRDLVTLRHVEKEQRGLYTGRLAAISELIHRVPSSWEEVERTADIRAVRVDEMASTTASASLEATTRNTHRHPLYGDWSTTTDFTGPVRLVRADGAWRIADFCLGGRMCLDSTVLVESAVRLLDVTVTVRLLAIDARETTAFFECANAAAAPATIELVGASIRKPGRLTKRWEYRPIDGDRQILPGETGFAKVVWRTGLPLETAKVQMLVRARDLPRHTPYVFRLEVHLPSLEERRSAP